MGRYKRVSDYVFTTIAEAEYFCDEAERRVKAHGLLSVACIEKIINYCDLYQSDMDDDFVGWIPSMVHDLKIECLGCCAYQVHLGRPVRLLSKRLLKKQLRWERRLTSL